MRLDRFITLNLVQPLCRVTSDPSRITCLPILMYHSVSDDPEPRVHPYHRVCIGPARFRQQMQWLKSSGYHGVTLAEGLTWLGSSPKMEDGRCKIEVPKRNGESPALNSESRTPNSELCPVAITFDDGFRDFYTAAYPILQEHGFSASVFLPTAFIGDGTRRLFKSRECMTWSEVVELHKAGIEFGSHTISHPILAELDWLEVKKEVSVSKDEIESHLGARTDSFAYPYAFPEANKGFVNCFRQLLMDAGYHSCATTRIGTARHGDDLLQIKRLPVNSSDDLALFQAKLMGAYDWLARPQRIIKSLKCRRLFLENPAMLGRSPTGVLIDIVVPRNLIS